MIIWFFSKVEYKNSEQVIQFYLDRLEYNDLFVEASVE